MLPAALYAVMLSAAPAAPSAPAPYLPSQASFTLRGTVPVRCAASIEDVTVGGASAIIFVRDECNTEHRLNLIGVPANRAGMMGSGSPIGFANGVSAMTIDTTGMEDDEKQQMLSTLRVEVIIA